MYCKNCGAFLETEKICCDKCGTVANKPEENSKINTMSVVGMIVAMVSLLLNFWGIVGIAAIVISAIGLIQIKETGERGKTLAISGVSIGAISVVYAFFIIISYI